MSRGFNVSVRAASPDDINEGSLAAEIAAQGALSDLEPGYLANAMIAARALAAALRDGPFVVILSGIDHTREPGESSHITVSVETRFTASDDSAPASVPAPPTFLEPEPTVVAEPAVGSEGE